MVRPPYFVPDDRHADGVWRVKTRAGSYVDVPLPNRFQTRDEARTRAKELNTAAKRLTSGV